MIVWIWRREIKSDVEVVLLSLRTFKKNAFYLGFFEILRNSSKYYSELVIFLSGILNSYIWFA